MNELELKFSLPLSLQDALAAEPGSDRTERVWSRYFDTPDGALARARIAVRVRRKGDAWLQAVKADHGDHFERFEWERPIAGPEPERDALPPDDTATGSVVHRSFGQWAGLFETDFERRSRVVEPAPGLAVEIARDVGEVRCGERREPIREVELECLRGSRAAFFEWARDWAERHRACLLLPTKNERGLRLAARLPLAPAPSRAVAPPPAADVPVGEAAASIVRGCVAHACANVEPILACDDPEGPHQLRVALRRLRAALRLLGLREVDPRWNDVDASASARADVAGGVRDLDVFESGALVTLREHFPDDAAIETLARALVDAREAARMTLRRQLAGPAFTRFALGALALAESLATRTDAGESADAGRFDAFAGARIHALLARVRRRARRARTEADWHRVRLAVKTLRYALDFARAAPPRGVDIARAATLLARWQDALGAGQDLAAAREVAADALARPGVPAQAAVRAIALIDGWRAFAAPGGGGAPARRARRTLRELEDALRTAAPKPPTAPGATSSPAPAPAPAPVPASASASASASTNEAEPPREDDGAGPDLVR